MTEAEPSPFVAYYRVSTDSQGQSGLGLDAQRDAILKHMDGRPLFAEFVEVESGDIDERPELEKALILCKRHKATLIVSKLDRLSRRVHFISGLMDKKIRFFACDCPYSEPFMIHVYAAVAEHERQLISERTKAGLAQARARGVKLGGYSRVQADRAKAGADAHAESIRQVIEELRESGAKTVRAIADGLNNRGVKSRLGRTWHPQTVSILLRRLA